MKSLYSNNWYCYCFTHVCIITFLGPFGFHFVIPNLYNAKCYSPYSFLIQLMYLLLLVHSFFVELFSVEFRTLLFVLYIIYYILLFFHMYCFLSESFVRPVTTWEKVSQKKKLKKQNHLIV